MPRGIPRIGSALTSAAEELVNTPEPAFVGTINTETLSARTPSFDDDGPPPWETDPRWGRDNTDARRFVDCPDEWVLRWLNPRLIDQTGFRDWKAVPASHERVTLKVPAMRSPENLIRRGGHGGDILSYMPRSWVDSRRRIKEERARRAVQGSVDRQQQLAEEVNRGSYGPHIRVSGEMKHPTNTTVEGRSLTD